MLRASFLVALFLAAAVPAPDDRTADFDPKMDFSQFKTLALSINTFSEGTLVVDVLRRPGRELVWRGIYRDDEGNASKLFEKYPVKKK